MSNWDTYYNDYETAQARAALFARRHPGEAYAAVSEIIVLGEIERCDPSDMYNEDEVMMRGKPLGYIARKIYRDAYDKGQDGFEAAWETLTQEDRQPLLALTHSVLEAVASPLRDDE